MSTEEGEIETKTTTGEDSSMEDKLQQQHQQDDASSTAATVGDASSEYSSSQLANDQRTQDTAPVSAAAISSSLRKRTEAPEDDNAEGAARYQPRVRVHNERLIKVLLTGHEAGVLIGRGGNSVNELQNRTGARVKVSNNTMLFPGTNFRIILIEGGAESIEDVIKTLVGICLQEYNKRESIVEGTDSEITFLLSLPSAAAPVVIGKRGATVLELNKQSGCNIRLGRMEDEIPGVRERIARFTGRAEQIVAGVMATIELIYKDTVGRAWLYDNKSTIYDVAPALAPTSSLYAPRVVGHHRQDIVGYRGEDRGGSGYVPRDPRQYSSRPLTRLDPPPPSDYPSSRYDRYERDGGAPPPMRSEYVRRAGDDDRRRTVEDRDDHHRAGSRRVDDRRGGDDVYHLHHSNSRHSSSSYRTSDGPPPPLPATSSGNSSEHKLQVSVPDEFVGQMLGRAGENISLIQRQTQTRISVSPRTEFVPGTRDRIVTICGSSYAACRDAEALLGDKLPKV